MKDLMRKFLSDESGQGLVEYVLIIALVAVGLIAIMVLFRNAIGNTFKTVRNKLDSAPSTAYS